MTLRTPSDRWPAVDTPHLVDTAEQADRLAEHLLDAARDRPVVAISTMPGASGACLDADGIADEVAGLVPVVVLSAAACAGLSDGLGDPERSVFAGAGRLYPVGTAWASDGPAAPLYLCTGVAQGQRLREQLTADALAAAHEAGLLAAPPAPTGVSALVRGEVAGFSSDHHVVMRYGNGQQAVLHAARLRLDVPPERLLRNGQQLTGRVVGDGPFPTFLPELPMVDVPTRIRREYPDGATVPAKVVSVGAQAAQVLLHPDYPAELTEPDVDLTLLLAPGDVVPVEIAWSEGTCLVGLGRAAGSDLALSVLPGGPPWLLLDSASPATTPTAPAVAPNPMSAAGDASSPSTTRGPAALLPAPGLAEAAREDEARVAISWYAARTERLEDEAALLRRQADDMRAGLRAAHLDGKFRTLPEVYADEEAQFRWEVEVSYLRHVAEADRERYPLPTFVIGPAFLAQLDALRGIPQRQVRAVVVDVLCGRASTAPRVQPRRSAAGQAQAARDDGALGWQARLPERSSSPRLLHYWRLADGEIELDTVGVREDAPG